MNSEDKLVELRIKVLEESVHLSKMAKKHFNIKVSPFIMYDLKSSRALGSFDPNIFVINLNEKLLCEFGDLYIKEVFVHEFAHAVVAELYEGIDGVKPHGKEFKKICNVFGIDGKATTNLFKDSKFLKTKAAKWNKIPHKCKCEGKITYLTPYRARQAKEKIIICSGCKKKFKKIHKNK